MSERENESLIDFMNFIKRANAPRIHKVRGSYGVYDGFKFYRKIRPKEHKYVLTESQYFSIIRKVNKLLGESLINGEDVTLPYRLGSIEIRKYGAKITIDSKGVRTNLPIDWDKTLKLWYEDQEAFENRTLIKVEEEEIFKIYYNKELANYNNKSFYEFKFNKDLKIRLKQKIKEGVVDAPLLKRKEKIYG